MKPSIPTAASETTCHLQTNKCVMGNKIMVGTAVKAKVGDLEEEIREGFLMRLRKEITAAVQ